MGVMTSLYDYMYEDSICDDENVVDPEIGLTGGEKRLIVESWTILGDKRDQKRYGVNLFIYLFNSYPELQSYFAALKNDTPEELEVSPSLRAHATTVMYQIGAFVNNLDDPACLVELAQKVAKNHRSRKIGFTEFEQMRRMFGLFLRAQLGSRATPGLVSAWNKLLTILNAIIDDEYKKNTVGLE